MAAKKNDGEKTKEENFEEFVLQNEERIMEILMAGKSNVESKIGAEKEKGKAFVKGMVEAITNPEVTEHFMSMGIELLLGIGALVKAMPWPEEMQPFVEMVSEQKDTLSSVMCKRNPNCGAKGNDVAPAIEKIELK